MRLLAILLLGVGGLLAAFSASPQAPSRTSLTADMTYVLSAGQTKQGVLDSIVSNIDARGFNVTISDPSCVDTSPLVLDQPGVGIKSLTIAGNPSSACPVNTPAGSDISTHAFDLRAALKIHLRDFRPSTAGGQGNDLNIMANASVELGYFEFGQSGGDQVSVAGGGNLAHAKSYKIVGGALRYHHHIPVGGVIGANGSDDAPILVTFENNPHFGNCYVGIGYGIASYSKVSWVGSFTCGNVNLAHFNGVVSRAGDIVQLPGGPVDNRGGNDNDNIGTTDLTVNGLALLRGGFIKLGDSQGPIISADAQRQLRLEPAANRCVIAGGEVLYCAP